MNTKGSFDDWLNERHGKMDTPSAVVDSVVQRAINSPIAYSKRLVIGQDNEVYDVTTSDNQKIIVRISHKEDPRFEAERWALDAARKHGAPTPQVYFVEKVRFEEKSVTFSIEEKLPGVPLDILLEKGAGRPERAIQQIGEVLSQIHSVKVEGFGYLQPTGKGWDIPFSKIMLDLLEKEDELKQSAEQWEFSLERIEQGLKLLEGNTRLYEWNEPSLTHGDFGPAHVLVEDDRITGIIDFQECTGNHPIFDFVHWDCYWDRKIPTKDLIASYQNKTLFDESYEPLYHLVLLRFSLWMLIVRAEYENPYGIDIFKRGIEHGLGFFSKNR